MTLYVAVRIFCCCFNVYFCTRGKVYFYWNHKKCVFTVKSIYRKNDMFYYETATLLLLYV